MSRGRYLALSEAQRLGKLKQFVREHAVEPEVPNFKERFGRLLGAMTSGKREATDQTSDRESSED